MYPADFRAKAYHESNVPHNRLTMIGLVIFGLRPFRGDESIGNPHARSQNVAIDAHVGLLVHDIDRAAQFYVDAFGGRVLIRPIMLGGETAETVMSGPPGTKFRVCMVRLSDGLAVELFEFVGDAKPDWALAQKRGSLPHVAVRVDETQATLKRVEAAGGKRVWRDVAHRAGGSMIYVEDVDGNVLEIIDMSVETAMAGLLELFPEAAP